MPPRRDISLTVENAHLMFRNFAGRKGTYNEEGDRNFNIFFDRGPEDTELARRLEADGWNIKWKKGRDEDAELVPRLEVAVQYAKGRPPRVVMITSRGRVDLGADEVEVLDFARIKNADVILNGFPWDVNGRQGIKAYLQTAYITLDENELDLKYADVQDARAGLDDEEDH